MAANWILIVNICVFLRPICFPTSCFPFRLDLQLSLFYSPQSQNRYGRPRVMGLYLFELYMLARRASLRIPKSRQKSAPVKWTLYFTGQAKCARIKNRISVNSGSYECNKFDLQLLAGSSKLSQTLNHSI